MRDGPVTELHWLGVAEAAGAIAAKDLSPVELMKALLDRIAALDPQLNAFIRLDGEAALQAAKAAEAEASRGPAARAAARRAGRHQGHHRCRRPADDLPFQDPAGQPRDRRCRLRRKAARRRRHRARQALDPRVRHRRAELRPAVAAGAQSVEHRPSSRRLVVGLGLGRRRPACSRWRWAATPAAACAIRRAAAASSASSRPTAWCRGAASSRSPSPSTMSGR